MANCMVGNGPTETAGESTIDWPTPSELIRAAVAAACPDDGRDRCEAEHLWARTRVASNDGMPDGDTPSELVKAWLRGEAPDDDSVLEIDPIDDDEAAQIVGEPAIGARTVDSLLADAAIGGTPGEERGSAPTLDALAAPRAIAAGSARAQSDSDPLTMRIPVASVVTQSAFVPPPVVARAPGPVARRPSEISTLPPPPVHSPSRMVLRDHAAAVYLAIIGFAAGSLCTTVAMHAALPARAPQQLTTSAPVARRAYTRRPVSARRVDLRDSTDRISSRAHFGTPPR
jgi:hypothetical protein